MADHFCLPDAAAPGPHGAACSTVVVDLHLRWPRWSAPARWSAALGLTARAAQEPHHRRRGRTHGVLRDGRRHEGHDLGADRQGGPAHGRLGADRRAGARKFGFNLSELLGTRRDQQRQGNREAPAGPATSTAPRPRARSTSRSASRSCSARAGLPHVLIRFYTVPTSGRLPEVRALGDRPDRHVHLFTLVLGSVAAMLDEADYASVAASGGNLASPLPPKRSSGGGRRGRRWSCSPPSRRSRSRRSWPWSRAWC